MLMDVIIISIIIMSSSIIQISIIVFSDDIIYCIYIYIYIGICFSVSTPTIFNNYYTIRLRMH